MDDAARRSVEEGGGATLVRKQARSVVNGKHSIQKDSRHKGKKNNGTLDGGGPSTKGEMLVCVTCSKSVSVGAGA